MGYHNERYPPGNNGCTGGKDHPCNGFVINDTDRCYFHTPPGQRHKIKQEKRLSEVAVIVNESIFNDETHADSPVEALIQELSRTQHIVRWLGAKLDQIAQLHPEQFAQLVTQEVEEGTKPMPFKSGAAFTNVLRRQLVSTESGMSPWVVWFLRERDHLVKVTGLLVALGVKLDQLEISRRQADMLNQAMAYLAAGLGHDPDDPAIAAQILQAFEAIIEEKQAADPHRVMR
jgi:hypothetical protein